MLVFPTISDSSHYSFDIDLEDNTYRFYFDWNDRSASWFMTLTDVSDNVVLGSKRIALNTNLLLPRQAGGPPGSLYAADTSLDYTSPGYDELGKRVILVYFDSTEI